MDAVEFYKAFKRICYKTDCKDCLLDQKCRPSANVEPKEVVELVEEWAKEHPIKTRQSEFLRMFPNADLCRDVIDISPCSIEKEMRKCCGDRNCGECKRTYWLAEVTDNGNVY